MTVDLPWFRYEVAPPLKSIPLDTDLLTIYQKGGLVLPTELGAYITCIRKQKDLSLQDVSTLTGMPIGVLSSMEKGMIRYVKLHELIRLDEVVQRGGELLMLYWWEITSRLELEQCWQANASMESFSPHVKHTLASLLISVGRWLQVIYQDEQCSDDWHRTIRYVLRHQSPMPPVPPTEATTCLTAA